MPTKCMLQMPRPRATEPPASQTRARGRGGGGHPAGEGERGIGRGARDDTETGRGRDCRLVERHRSWLRIAGRLPVGRAGGYGSGPHEASQPAAGIATCGRLPAPARGRRLAASPSCTGPGRRRIRPARRPHPLLRPPHAHPPAVPVRAGPAPARVLGHGARRGRCRVVPGAAHRRGGRLARGALERGGGLRRGDARRTVHHPDVPAGGQRHPGHHRRVSRDGGAGAGLALARPGGGGVHRPGTSVSPWNPRSRCWRKWNPPKARSGCSSSPRTGGRWARSSSAGCWCGGGQPGLDAGLGELQRHRGAVRKARGLR